MGLQVWLPLNGNLNNLGLADVSLGNNGATVDNSGKIGKCYSFNGVNNYIVINNFDMGELAEYSISCWVKPNGNDISFLFLVRGGGTHQIRISYDGFMFRDTKNSSQRTVAFGEGFTDGQWTHICCVYIRGEIYLYQNGIQTAHSDTHYHADGQTNSNNTEIRIGLVQSSTGYSYFSGCVNDFRIYDTALSPREVKEISKGLVLHYPLSGGGGCENLMKDSNFSITSGSNTSTVKIATLIPVGTIITVSVQIDADDVVWDSSSNFRRIGIEFNVPKSDTTGTQYLGAWAGQELSTSNIVEAFTGSFHGRISKTFTTLGEVPALRYVGLHIQGVTSGTVRVSNPKVELGSVATPWIPNVADTEYTTMGFNDGIEYDVSGYGHNATIVDDVSYSSDTPRYNTALSLDGNGHINCGHAFHIQGALNISVSLWAYLDDWADNVWEQFLSSEEAGGIVVAKSSANGIRGRFNVYTAEDLSAHTYKQADVSADTVSSIGVTGSGWHHIVTTYDANVGIKTYIDGVKRATSNFVSYGACFNSSASMMLGAECYGANNYQTRATCKLSDVRFYYTTLTDDDILELYNTPISLSNNGTLLTQGEYEES